MRTSTLPFDPEDLKEIRVRPAEFARMVGVSKQAVSKAIKQGRLTLGPDGRLDPKKGVREYIETTDPTRLRARTFRTAVSELDELRQRATAQVEEITRLREEIEAERRAGDARAQAARFAASDEAWQRLTRVLGMIATRWDEAAAAQAAGAWDEWTDALLCEESGDADDGGSATESAGAG